MEPECPPPAAPSIGPREWRALIGAFLGWMLDGMDIMLYAFALTAIRDEFGLSSAAVGSPSKYAPGRPWQPVSRAGQVLQAAPNRASPSKLRISPSPPIASSCQVSTWRQEARAGSSGAKACSELP